MSNMKPEHIKRTLELALDVALITGDLKMLEQAFNKGADAQAALQYGHKTANWKTIDAAIKAGATLDAACDGSATGDTFLINAIKTANYSDLAKGYLDRGADPNLTYGEKTASVLIFERLKACRGDEWNHAAIKNIATRLLEALPAADDVSAHVAADMTVKKEVVLTAPKVLKATAGKPAP